MSGNDWGSIDWDRLQRLRSLFLDPSSIDGPYWQDEDDLLAYDLTFAARIGWKWDAVLEELARRDWSPPSTRIYDWGCGTGIATRRLLAAFPDHPWESVDLWDHSPLATGFARKRIGETRPDLDCRIQPPDQIEPDSIILVSHALGEASEEDLRELWDKIRKAQELIVVEPGTYESSRGVIAVREVLKDHFTPIAPCTHTEPCGLLTEGNSRHWCHHFGRAPAEVFMDGNWARFAKTLEIDLRSLPYSYIVLDKTTPRESSGNSRILGRPRFYKGHCKILSCQSSGVHEYELQKRTDKILWKTLKKGRHSGLFEWELDGNRIAGGREIAQGN
jgi:ribosomal protein RSM22 (predicted rRNA methylase)